MIIYYDKFGQVTEEESKALAKQGKKYYIRTERSQAVKIDSFKVKNTRWEEVNANRFALYLKYLTTGKEVYFNQSERVR